MSNQPPERIYLPPSWRCSGQLFKLSPSNESDLEYVLAATVEKEREELVGALSDCASLMEEMDGVSWFPESDFKPRNYAELQKTVLDLLSRNSKGDAR